MATPVKAPTPIQTLMAKIAALKVQTDANAAKLQALKAAKAAKAAPLAQKVSP